MGDPTIQAAGQQTDHRTDQQTDQPTDRRTGKETKKKKKLRAELISAASLVVAIGAAAVAGWQLSYSNAERIATEQNQLVTLTSNIAGQLASQGTTTSKAKGSFALSDALVAKLTVEGQAGTVIIADLNNSGVAAYEYIEVGQALAYGGDKADAITYYSSALSAPPRNAVTRATALRYRGLLYYDLSKPAKAHQDMIQAARAFSGRPLEPPSYIANSIAQAYVVDAYHQLVPFKGCSTARDDMQKARKVLGTYQENSLVQAFMVSDSASWKWAKCKGSL
jgi:tetratricopeptide (TPR) repeat protein